MQRVSLIIAFIIICILPCFAMNNTLQTSWNYYKKHFISNDGRVIDYQKNSITTSEGQSYAMLRAVLIDDKETFNLVYNWAKNNLQRKDNSLFAWLWGQNSNGEYKILDNNTATDSDIDIAFALILASKKWTIPQYENNSKKIILDIWNNEVVKIKDKYVLASGIEQAKDVNVSFNPSYFAPYAFRVFANIDKSNDWNKLVDDSYYFLEESCKHTKTGLPPDWVLISKETGKVLVDKNSPKSYFSYDAIRTFFRIYLDYSTNKDKRAKQFLEKTKFITNKYKHNNKLYINYSPNGEPTDNTEYLAGISMILPSVKTYNKSLNFKLSKEYLDKQYSLSGYWGDKNDYYTQNLVWFYKWLEEYEKQYKK